MVNFLKKFDIKYFFNKTTAQFIQLDNIEKKNNFKPLNNDWVEITKEAFDMLSLMYECLRKETNA